MKCVSRAILYRSVVSRTFRRLVKSSPAAVGVRRMGLRADQEGPAELELH
jgi:hypothetical protein